MTRSMNKDLRLWDKRNGILPYETRSRKLARDLMNTIGLKESIIDSFKEGKILKTNCINPLSIIQVDVSERDKEIISELNQNGLLVYHILFSYIMIGKKTEIQCEHEVSTFENVIPTVSYLCVPKDIYVEALSTDDGVANESNRETVIKEYIEHDIFMANQGCLYAYVESDTDGSADFFYIEVNVFNGNLLRVN